MGERSGIGATGSPTRRARTARVVRLEDERIRGRAMCEPAARSLEERGEGWAVVLPDAPDQALEPTTLPSPGTPGMVPPVERVIYTAPAAAGLTLWCSMAALAQQLAKANASQAAARHALERENDRLAGDLEAATAVLAGQAEELARARRRATWLVYGLSLLVAALGALLLVLGPLAAVGRLGA